MLPRWARIILSVLALVIAGFGSAAAGNLLTVNAALSEFVIAVGGVLAMFGVSVPRVPQPLAKLLFALSGLVAGAVAAHAGGAFGQPTDHTKLFHMIGLAGIVVGSIGRLPPPAPSPPAGTPHPAG